MVAHIRRVVAGGACAHDHLLPEHIVQPGYAGDVELFGVEQILSVADLPAICGQPGVLGLAIDGRVTTQRSRLPGFEEDERGVIEVRVVERVIDAREEGREVLVPLRQHLGELESSGTGSVTRLARMISLRRLDVAAFDVQRADQLAADLSREQVELEIGDGGYLCVGGRGGSLGVAEGRINRLML